MLIITGTGRSGTGTMARLLGGHHEFRVHYLLDKYFLKADPHGTPFDTIEKRVRAILDLHQGIDPAVFIDSSNLYIHFIDAVHALNPSAKFILCVRNGKDFVRSAASRNWHLQNLYGTVPPRSDPYFEKWERMDPLERNAWIWVYRNRKALDGLDMVPELQRLIMRIEDIHQNIGLIRDFSGVAIQETSGPLKRHNANPSSDFPPGAQWTRDMQRRFDTVAGEMMRFFNYE